MNYYLDITLQPAPEVPMHFIWQKVYQHIHHALCDAHRGGKTDIGVSFPDYNDERAHLGRTLRLHAAGKPQLDKLNLNFTPGLADYLRIAPVQPVPEEILGHAYFKRIQLKNNNERLARRRAKRKDISLQQALAYYTGRNETYCNAPYVQIKSHSTGRFYQLFIIREYAQHATIQHSFSTYGLSSNSSVPLF